MGKTIAEKIFDAHRIDMPFPDTHVLKLDRVFCHEITTPIAITDLMARGMDRVFDPTKIKVYNEENGAVFEVKLYCESCGV